MNALKKLWQKIVEFFRGLFDFKIDAADLDIDAPPKPTSRPVTPAVVSTNIYSGPTTDRANPSHPDYEVNPQVGTTGWQLIMRRWARDEGLEDNNTFVKQRGLRPLFPDAKQSWEAN